MNEPQPTLRFGAVWHGLLLALGLAALGFFALQSVIKARALDRTVVVKGLSEREVPADVASWSIPFQVAADTLDELYAQIELNQQIVASFLTQYGIDVAEYRETPPRVMDRLAQGIIDDNSIGYRYTATAAVAVYTRQVEAVRDAQADLIELGKRGVAISEAWAGPDAGSNEFLFSGLNALKPTMIEEATRNARMVAERFAADSDSRLGKIKSARQGQFSIENRDANTPHLKTVRVVSTIEYYLTD